MTQISGVTCTAGTDVADARSAAERPWTERQGPLNYGVKDLGLMFTTMTVSAVLVVLWQATLTPEEKLAPVRDRYGSFAGPAFFVLSAVALR